MALMAYSSPCLILRWVPMWWSSMSPRESLWWPSPLRVRQVHWVHLVFVSHFLQNEGILVFLMFFIRLIAWVGEPFLQPRPPRCVRNCIASSTALRWSWRAGTSMRTATGSLAWPKPRRFKRTSTTWLTRHWDHEEVSMSIHFFWKGNSFWDIQSMCLPEFWNASWTVSEAWNPFLSEMQANSWFWSDLSIKNMLHFSKLYHEASTHVIWLPYLHRICSYLFHVLQLSFISHMQTIPLLYHTLLQTILAE